jgi:Uri superfamily endonuclease
MKRVTMLGGGATGGAYVLRIGVGQNVDVRFGRFNRGQSIAVPAGDYLYVGSAVKGLARRLLRHASRADPAAPHAIRADLEACFISLGLINVGQSLPKTKCLHWHIDYLLELADTELLHAYAIGSHRRLEQPIARSLEQDPATFVLAQGLGASEAPGCTHLLGVSADKSWWEALPNRLGEIARSLRSQRPR